MVEEFAVSYRVNEGSDSLVALNFAAEGSGAALMAAAAFLHYRRGVIAGCALVILGLLFLFGHLGNSIRCWRVLAGLRNAWISRGAFFATVLVVAGLLYILSDGGPGPIITTVTILCGLLTALYSGFFVASMTSIPFWNSPLTPVLFLLHSMSTGLGILLVLKSGHAPVIRTAGVVLGLMAATLLVTLIHMIGMKTGAQAARESVALLLQGDLKLCFVGGALVAGLGLPLAMIASIYLGLSSANVFGIAVVAIVIRIAGDVAFRYSILRAGICEAII